MEVKCRPVSKYDIKFVSTKLKTFFRIAVMPSKSKQRQHESSGTLCTKPSTHLLPSRLRITRFYHFIFCRFSLLLSWWVAITTCRSSPWRQSVPHSVASFVYGIVSDLRILIFICALCCRLYVPKRYQRDGRPEPHTLVWCVCFYSLFYSKIMMNGLHNEWSRSRMKYRRKEKKG